MTSRTIWMRFQSRHEAFNAAKRLTAVHGNRFALVFDDMGIAGFDYPYAVISY